MVHPQQRWKKTLLVASRSDIGLRRANNQDSYAVVLAETARDWFERGHLFVVADGMGAHAAGEVASQTATETIVSSYAKRIGEQPVQALVHAVYDAHYQIREQSARDEAYHDMGTTVDATLILPQGCYVAHVGDSRVYRWRHDVIEQLTFDHSLVWEVCVANHLPFDQAPSYIPRNQITRSLGPTAKLVVDIEGPYSVEVGDVFFSCSDGLSGQLTDKEMGQIVGVLEPEEATESLINLANLRGGPDNITVVIAKAVASTEPVQVVRRFPKTAWLWLVLTFLSSLLLFYGVQGQVVPMIVCGGAGALGGLGGFLYLLRDLFLSPSPYHRSGYVYGSGPYTKHECPPSSEFTEKLVSILNQFRVVTQGEHWNINWKNADEHEKMGASATESQDYGVAIAQYCLAINHLMNELKKQRGKK